MALAWASWGVEPDSLDARRRAIENAEQAGGDKLVARARALRRGGRRGGSRRRARVAHRARREPGRLPRASRAPSRASCGRAAPSTRRPFAPRDGPHRRRAVPARSCSPRWSRSGSRARRWTGGACARDAALGRGRRRPARGPRVALGGDGARAAPRGARRAARGRRGALGRRARGHARERRAAGRDGSIPDAPVPFVAGGSASGAPREPRARPAGLRSATARGGAPGDRRRPRGRRGHRRACRSPGGRSLRRRRLEPRARRVREGRDRATGRPRCVGGTARVRARRPGTRPFASARRSELGARCQDDSRARGVLGGGGAPLARARRTRRPAKHALEASFARDATRPVAFDKLFRRVRARKDNEKLLALVSRRLEVTDDPTEIQKLFWEQARVLREGGDQDGALKALEHVTMLDPDHVGALALARRDQHPSRELRGGRRLARAPRQARGRAREEPRDRRHRGGRPLREQARALRRGARGAPLAAPGQALEPARTRAARARRGPNRIVEGRDRHPPGAHARAARGRRPHRGGAARDGDPPRPAGQSAGRRGGHREAPRRGAGGRRGPRHAPADGSPRRRARRACSRAQRAPCWPTSRGARPTSRRCGAW